MLTYQRAHGSTDVSVVIRIIDSTDGTPETGVVFDTAGIDLEYRREGAASTDITEATLAALTTAHTDGGFLHIGNGYYRLDLPDAACAAGVSGVLVHGTVTGMVVIGCYIHLGPAVADLTHVSGSAVSTSTAQIGVNVVNFGGTSGTFASGRPQVNVSHWSGSAVSPPNTSGIPIVDIALVNGQPNPASNLATVFDTDFLDSYDSVSNRWNANIEATETAAIADAVWDEALVGHVGAGSAGERVGRVPNVAAGAAGGLFIAGSNAATTVNITGSLSGSVGSVTGAVGSVAGNVDGNVSGTVASVVGAVGSVTGAVGSVTGAVGSVTAGVTVTTNNDKTGYTLSATGSAAMTEGYGTDGSALTLPQAIYLILAHVGEFAISGTTKTLKRLDGSTTAATCTLDSSSTPTSITRAT